jgi:hypothetical protein
MYPTPPMVAPLPSYDACLIAAATLIAAVDDEGVTPIRDLNSLAQRIWRTHHDREGLA